MTPKMSSISTAVVVMQLFWIAWTTGTYFPESYVERGPPAQPKFVEDIRNVTVPAGREATLSCVVSNLGAFKVGWIKEDQTILTLDAKVVTHNNRVSVTHDGVETWNLHIRQIKPSDVGCYVCQVNTAIMMKQMGCIDVHVSPTIMDEETSTDITVREGDNVTLFCKARGHPEPRIIWKREDGETIKLRRGYGDSFRGFDNITGETIQFFRVNRRQMGSFLCIATNDVPPAKSKRIVLDVNFPPLIKVPLQVLGAPFGNDVTLVCHVEACPRSFSYWLKNLNQMLMVDAIGLKNSTKYVIEEKRSSYKTYMRLTIRNFNKDDEGIYSCVASNSLGKAEGSVRLHEIKVGRSTSSTSENHSPTRSGYATTSSNIESARNPSKNNVRHRSNKEDIWKTYAVAPKDSVISSIDSSSQMTDNDASSSSMMSGSISSSSFLIGFHYHHHHFYITVLLIICRCWGY